ncbi:MAG TPA: crotonase/enoyl-CoA hydratase family protein [Polyangiales bacterium]
MDSPVSVITEGSATTIRMDDGKRNALSLRMLQALDGALTSAETARLPVVLTGRADVLSAGFDLKVMLGGPRQDMAEMLRSGFRLARRMLSFPLPVIIACPGHAVAMGAFLLLSADFRLGAQGDFKIVANEVAIGMTLPAAAVELCRQRLTPVHFQRATLLSELYDPERAVEAGFLDRVVPPDQLLSSAYQLAAQFKQLNMTAHAQTKQRLRAQNFEALDRAFEADEAQLRALG